MRPPDPAAIAAMVPADPGTGASSTPVEGGSGKNDDLAAAMRDLGEALAKQDWDGAAEAFRSAQQLADNDV